MTTGSYFLLEYSEAASTPSGDYIYGTDYSSFEMDNTGDHLYLKEKSGGTTIDAVGWGTDTAVWSSNQPSQFAEGRSMGRYPDGTDTNQPGDWADQGASGTPKASDVPEFTTIILPTAGMIALFVVWRRKKGILISE